MREILDAVDRRTAEFRESPFFAFLRDRSVEPARRLAFVPYLSHFVMTFADLYTMVLREEPPSDDIQALVNAHTREDAGHWKWFLADLEKLGVDREQRLSDSIKLLWGDATVRTRMLSYQMCRLGLPAQPLRRLVLVLCIEATGKVALERMSEVGREWSAGSGKPLTYFGVVHVDTEADHTIESGAARRAIADIRLSPEEKREYGALVDESFALFTAVSGEMLDVCRATTSKG